MRKITLSLISMALISGALSTKTYSDKTFLMPRNQITNLAMEYTIWHKPIHRKADAKYNGTIQVINFYQESTNKIDIGKYFGFDWGGNVGILNQIGVANSDEEGNFLKQPRWIIHDHANPEENYGDLKANYKFEPYQEVYGIEFGYHQDLDKILDGLFFRIQAPFVAVRNNMNLTSLITEVKQALPAAAPAVGTEVGFLSYLSGRVENTNANDKQEQLKYAKIDGTSQSATGVADIETMLGYTLWHKDRLRADLNISMIIPTGKTPKAEYLFEPVHGNGNHWGVGVGFDTCCTFWKGENKSIDLLIVGKYKYLFEGKEKRTLDFTLPYPGANELNAALYYNLGGQRGQQKVFPLANVLTQDLKIRPGSNFDGIVVFSFNIDNFIFDLGYNFFFKEEENVSLRFPWENDTYAVAAADYQTNAGFVLTHGNAHAYGGAAAANDTNVAIQSTHLDFDSVKSPYQVTHKIYAGIGYECAKDKNPIMIGAGGSYEYCSRNAALEGWALWIKGGLSW